MSTATTIVLSVLLVVTLAAAWGTSPPDRAPAPAARVAREPSPAPPPTLPPTPTRRPRAGGATTVPATPVGTPISCRKAGCHRGGGTP